MKVYTTGEVAEILGVTIPTVRKEIENNRLVAFKVASEYRVSEQSLHMYIGITDYEETIDKLKAELREKNRILGSIKTFLFNAEVTNETNENISRL